MGSLFGSPSMPAVPPPPPVPPAAIPPTMATPAVQQAGANQLARAAAGAAGGTVKTSAQGDLVKPSTTTPQLGASPWGRGPSLNIGG